MAESEITYPKSRLDLAFMLKRLHFNVNDSINELLDILGLDEDKKASVSCLFRRINTSLKKSHRPIESLSEDEWWNHEIPWQPCPKKNITNLESATCSTVSKSKHFRKSLLSLTIKQQRTRLESVLECVRLVAESEETSQITIASLVLQLLANERNNRDIASFAKCIAFGGNFGNELVKSLLTSGIL